MDLLNWFFGEKKKKRYGSNTRKSKRKLGRKYFYGEDILYLKKHYEPNKKFVGK